MRSSHRGTECIAELTREVGTVLSRVDEVACSVVSGLNASARPNEDGQPQALGPEEHEELCGLAATMLIRLGQTIGRITAASTLQFPSPIKKRLSHLHVVETRGV